MQSKIIKEKAIKKIILTLFRWIGLIFWLILIWAGFAFAIKLVCTALILIVECAIIYDNIKTKKSIWG